MLVNEFRAQESIVALYPNSPCPDSVKIEFKDAASISIKKSDLSQIDYFHKLESKDNIYVVPAVVDAKALQFVIGLIVDKKTLWDLLDNEQWQDPNIEEWIEAALNTFCLSKKESVMNDLRLHQLTHISLDNAVKVLDNFSTSGQPNEKLNNHVANAKEIVVLSMKFTRLNPTVFFDEIIKSAKGVSEGNRQVEDLRSQCNAIEKEAEPLKKELKALEDRVVALKSEIDSKTHTISSFSREILKKMECLEATRHNPAGIIKLSSQQTNPNPIIQEEAQAALKELEEYKTKLHKSLLFSGSKIDRDDLLQWVDGRKGWLFAHYGLQLKSSNTNYPFTRPKILGQCFGYRLDNLGPYYLEEEIRTDLSKQGIQLPQRLIANKEITRPLTTEEKALKEELLPKIRAWATLDAEDKKMIKQRLLILNGWIQSGITSDMFDLSSWENHEEGAISGTIQGSDKRLYLSTNTLQMWPEDMPGPDSLGSPEHFLKLHRRY